MTTTSRRKTDKRIKAAAKVFAGIAYDVAKEAIEAADAAGFPHVRVLKCDAKPMLYTTAETEANNKAIDSLVSQNTMLMKGKRELISALAIALDALESISGQSSEYLLGGKIWAKPPMEYIRQVLAKHGGKS